MRVSTLMPVMALSGLALGQILYATSDDGSVSTLTLSGSELIVSSTLRGCGANPSWLTVAGSQVFCSNEGTPGSLHSYAADAAGVLTEEAQVATKGVDVSSTLFGSGEGFIALAHYGQSAVSTFALPLANDSTPLQSLDFAFPGPGPDPTQTRGMPHQVVVDPSGRFMFSPDLGADVVRVFAIDTASGQLEQLDDIAVEDGSGPRHLAFYQDADNATYFYLGHELSSTLSAYRMGGDDAAPRFQQIIAPFLTVPEATNTSNIFLGEVRVQDDTVTVSNRGDASFGAEKDSLTVYTIGQDGALTTQGIYPSGGNFPRSFEFNGAGDMVAVGNQKSKIVTIARRDTETGAIGEVVATAELPGSVITVVWG